MASGILPSGVEFREVPGCPGYMAGADGSLWSCWTRGRWPKRTGTWAPAPQRREKKAGSHVSVLLRTADGFRVTEFVHRVILTTFVGPCPDGMIACHDPDPDPTNNAIANLRWATPTANVEDCKRHGRFARGAMMPQAKLRDEDVPEIFRLRAGGMSHIDIAKRYGVPRTLIGKVLRRGRYAHVPAGCDDPLPKRAGGKYVKGDSHHNSRLTSEKVSELRRLRSLGWTQRRIAIHLGVSQASVCAVLCGRTWREG